VILGEFIQRVIKRQGAAGFRAGQSTRVTAGHPRCRPLRLGRLAVGLVLTAAFAPAAEPPGQKVLSPFLDQYCLKCHDTGTQKGDREFES
jgi:hypothetical protein